MSTSTWKELIAVTLFLLGGLAALAFLAITVTGMRSGDEAHGYELNARFSEVANLSAHATVTMAGVRIGHVVSITPDIARAQAVVVMQLNGDVRAIASDATARVVTDGLLGGRSIAIQQGIANTSLRSGQWFAHTRGALILETLIDSIVHRASAVSRQPSAVKGA